MEPHAALCISLALKHFEITTFARYSPPGHARPPSNSSYLRISQAQPLVFLEYDSHSTPASSSHLGPSRQSHHVACNVIPGQIIACQAPPDLARAWPGRTSSLTRPGGPLLGTAMRPCAPPARSPTGGQPTTTTCCAGPATSTFASCAACASSAGAGGTTFPPRPAPSTRCYNAGPGPASCFLGEAGCGGWLGRREQSCLSARSKLDLNSQGMLEGWWRLRAGRLSRTLTAGNFTACSCLRVVAIAFDERACQDDVSITARSSCLQGQSSVLRR